MSQQHPTDEEVLERLKSAQAQARVFQLEAAHQSEARDDWSQAIAIYQDVISSFPHDQELAALLNAAQAHGNLLQLYADATHAIDSDDKPKAKRLLAQVLTQDPDYKNAAALLSQLVNPASEDGSVPFKLLLVIGSAFLSTLIGLGVLVSSILLLGFLSDSASAADVAILVTLAALFWLWWLVYRANKQEGTSPSWKLLVMIGSAFLSILIGLGIWLGVFVSSILLQVSFSYRGDYFAAASMAGNAASLATLAALFWLWWLIYRANKQEGTSPSWKLLLMIGSAFLSILMGLGIWLGVLVSSILLLGFLSASGDYIAVASMAGNAATLATLTALFWLGWLVYRANKQDGTSPSWKLLRMIGSAFLSILVGLGVLVSSILWLRSFSTSTLISAVTVSAVFGVATLGALAALFWLWWLIYRANKQQGTSPTLKLLLMIGSTFLSILISLGGLLVSIIFWGAFFYTNASDFPAATAELVVATLVALGTLFWLRKQEGTSPAFKILVKIESAFLSILIVLGVWRGVLVTSFAWMSRFFDSNSEGAVIAVVVAILVSAGIVFWLWLSIYRANKQEGTSPIKELLLMIGSAFLLLRVLVSRPLSVAAFFIDNPSPAAIAELVVATVVALGIFFRQRTLIVRSDNQG